jgi:predicted membrane channel-forming protein YqfA (hemolysin III family)
VSIVFVIILIEGALGVVAGIIRLFNRGDDLGWVSAAITIALGLIYLLVAKGIANGSRGARFLVALVSILWIIVGVWAFIMEPGLWLASTVQVLLGLATLGLLYNGKARAFFGA